MATESGKNGKVMIGAATVAEITGWRWTRTSNNPAYASSGTSGRKTRVAGVADSSGSVDFKRDFADTVESEGITEGALVTLLLYLNATTYHSVPAIIDSLSDEVDINDGETVSGSFDFSETGAPSVNQT